ncbi:MAG TPA: response regulator [Thermoanaerobaculia bacterium]|nr:response regulator [Thermoanaerobaculia bacterium]
MAPPILLVEDDLALAQLLACELETIGIPVEHSPSGELAIELLQAKHYPVIVMELILSTSGGISGGYVVKAIRKLPPEMRPLIVLMLNGSATLRGLDRSAVSAMLFKPLDVKLFTEYVFATYRRALEVTEPSSPTQPESSSVCPAPPTSSVR